MESALPMYNAHPYLSLTNLGTQVYIINGKVRYLPPEPELIDLGRDPGIGMLSKKPSDSNMQTGVRNIVLNLKLIQTKVKHRGFLMPLSPVIFFLT